MLLNIQATIETDSPYVFEFLDESQIQFALQGIVNDFLNHEYNTVTEILNSPKRKGRVISVRRTKEPNAGNSPNGLNCD